MLAHDQDAPDELKAAALTGAGVLAQSAGNYKLALAYLAESVALCRTTNNPVELGIALYQFARVAYRDGEINESALALEESIKILRRWSAGWYLALALSEKGIRAMYDGRLNESATLQEEAASIMRYNEDLLGLTVPLQNLALLAIYQLQYDRALSYCREALAILRSLNEHWMVAYTLEVVATAKCLNGRYTDAAQLLGAAERLRSSAGTAWPKNRIGDYEGILHTLRTSLSEEEFSRSWEAGRALSREEAIAAAMGSEGLT